MYNEGAPRPDVNGSANLHSKLAALDLCEILVRSHTSRSDGSRHTILDIMRCCSAVYIIRVRVGALHSYDYTRIECLFVGELAHEHFYTSKDQSQDTKLDCHTHIYC